MTVINFYTPLSAFLLDTFTAKKIRLVEVLEVVVIWIQLKIEITFQYEVPVDLRVTN